MLKSGCFSVGFVQRLNVARFVFSTILCLATSGWWTGSVQAADTREASKGRAEPKTSLQQPRVKLTTTLGDIVLELDEKKAPITVKNFLGYVDKSFYDGTQFHRVIDGFMIQGGGFDEKMQKKPVQAPIKNESSNGLSNLVGTIAMARTQAPDSATSQFFINVKDNSRSLDAKPGRPGYTVFGKVVQGMQIIDKIKGQKVQPKGMHRHVPVTPVVITSARRLK